jgi:hypothetical protein
MEQAPKNMVASYISIQNKHDISKTMELFTDDATFEVVGSIINLSGHEQIRGICEYDSVLGTIITASNFLTRGDTVYCDISETNEWLKAAGIDEANYYSSIFIVRDGKVAKLRAIASDETLSAFGAVLKDFVPWLEENYPGETKQLMPDGKFLYNGENGVLVLRLLKEWRSGLEV